MDCYRIEYKIAFGKKRQRLSRRKEIASSTSMKMAIFSLAAQIANSTCSVSHILDKNRHTNM